MKAYLTALLFKNALEYVDLAFKSNSDGMIEDEVRFSLGAHLMAALTLEGAINEIGESISTGSIWDKFEKIDTTLKWFFVPTLAGKEALSPGKDPLQTVQDLQRARNKIVHPKAIDWGNDIIIRDKSGSIKRNVALEDKVADGDTIFVGYGKLLAEFNISTARQAVRRTYSALNEIKNHTNYSKFEWLTGFPEEVQWLKV